jgi:IS30 family transposase
MDCKVKQHYKHSAFFLSANNISTIFMQTSTELTTQSARSTISLYILHIPSLKQYTSIAQFTVYLLCSKFEADHLITWYNFYKAGTFSEIYSHKVLTKQLQFPTYFLKSVELHFPSIINKELLSQEPCWLFPMNH